ncbi:MAG: SDR family oxidoreductase [Alphaproteobacteria bacterium]
MAASATAPRLFCFGLGYSALALGQAVRAEGWRVAGTCRSEEKRRRLAELGIEAYLFDRKRPLADPGRALAGTTHLLSSVPPDEAGDPVLDRHLSDITALATLKWVGYLSTTAVYGDHRGGWVDEETPLAPSGERGRRRKAAEARWLNLWQAQGLPAHVFRLAGIYGPGRSVLDAIRAGTAKRIAKPGQVFSRIHVDDIVATVRASMARPNGGRAYNVCDDRPVPPEEVVRFGCALLGVEPPPLVPLEEAKLTPTARSFYADNKRVRNDRIKEELGLRLKHPDYAAGLTAVLESGG